LKQRDEELRTRTTIILVYVSVDGSRQNKTRENGVQDKQRSQNTIFEREREKKINKYT